MNFFDLPLIYKGRPYRYTQYEEILKEQLLITLLSKGGVTISETADMPIVDRKIILKTLQDIETKKAEKREQLKAERAAKKKANK